MAWPESFTPKCRLARLSRRSPAWPMQERKAAIAAAAGSLGAGPCTAATKRPAATAASSPPAAPDQVLPGEIRGASRGPPIARPATYAPISVAQTRSTTNIKLARPAIGSARNETRATAASAIQASPATNTAGLPPRLQSCAHSNHSATVTAPMARSKMTPPYQIRTRAGTASTSAEVTRLCRSVQRRGLASYRADTEAPVAAGEFGQCGGEMLGAEIRPQDIEKHELGVGRLPEQEIRQSLLAGGADEEVGVGDAGSGEVAGDRFFVDRGGIEAAVARRLRQGPGGGGDLGPRAVGQRDRQVEAGVGAGGGLGIGEAGLDVGGEAATVPDHAEPDAVGGEFGELGFDGAAQQAGEVGDLGGGAAPVLAAEGIEREPADALAYGGFDRAAHGFSAFPVAGDPRQVAGGGPASVAVHDDGDVGWRRGAGTLTRHATRADLSRRAGEVNFAATGGLHCESDLRDGLSGIRPDG